jgi:hypothetical protein
MVQKIKRDYDVFGYVVFAMFITVIFTIIYTDVAINETQPTTCLKHYWNWENWQSDVDWELSDDEAEMFVMMTVLEGKSNGQNINCLLVPDRSKWTCTNANRSSTDYFVRGGCAMYVVISHK